MINIRLLCSSFLAIVRTKSSFSSSRQASPSHLAAALIVYLFWWLRIFQHLSNLHLEPLRSSLLDHYWLSILLSEFLSSFYENAPSPLSFIGFFITFLLLAHSSPNWNLPSSYMSSASCIFQRAPFLIHHIASSIFNTYPFLEILA